MADRNPLNKEDKAGFTISCDPSLKNLLMDAIEFRQQLLNDPIPKVSSMLRPHIHAILKENLAEIDRRGESNRFHEWRRVEGRQIKNKKKRENGKRH